MCWKTVIFFGNGKENGAGYYWRCDKRYCKGAAKLIIELGKDLGPIIVKTAAYGFFRNICG